MYVFIIIVFFPSTECEGSPFLLAVIVLVVNVGFPPFGPPRENGCYIFRAFLKRTPLDIRQHLKK